MLIVTVCRSLSYTQLSLRLPSKPAASLCSSASNKQYYHIMFSTCSHSFSLSSPELHVNHRRIPLQAARSDQLPPPTFCHPVFEGTAQASDLETVYRAQSQMCIFLLEEFFFSWLLFFFYSSFCISYFMSVSSGKQSVQAQMNTWFPLKLEFPVDRDLILFLFFLGMNQGLFFPFRPSKSTCF